MVDVGPLKELIINHPNYLRIGFKISLDHIALVGVERQNVKAAHCHQVLLEMRSITWVQKINLSQQTGLLPLNLFF